MKINKYTEVVKKLTETAGAARVRTLNEKDLISTLREAKQTEWGYATGGSVANAYKYPAYQMRLAVVKMAKGKYGIWMDWGSASSGASSLPGSLPRQYGKSDVVFGKILMEWANNTETEKQYVLSAISVNRALKPIR